MYWVTYRHVGPGAYHLLSCYMYVYLKIVNAQVTTYLLIIPNHIYICLLLYKYFPIIILSYDEKMPTERVINITKHIRFYPALMYICHYKYSQKMPNINYTVLTKLLHMLLFHHICSCSCQPEVQK